MKKLVAFDTSISTDNLGDEIIMDAVYDVLSEIAPNSYIVKIATHDFMGKHSLTIAKSADLSIVGGTNLLDSHMLSKSALWKLKSSDGRTISPVVLLGTGWRGYSGPLDASTDRLFKRMLSPEYVHSVRDSYSATKLTTAISNVSNTSCVTMWRLTPDHCAAISSKRANSVVTTLTYYDPQPAIDRKFLEFLQGKYRKVFFWPQQFSDEAYFNSLGLTGIEIIRPSSKAYSEFLDANDVDFIGTRLHGGVRALQRGHRALIIAIDNRATEIGRDTSLPVVGRDDINAIEEWIDGGNSTILSLPTSAINAWKAQFTGRF